MKIIQTLWLSNQEKNIHNKCGWLTQEYHLMSWSLSFTQLHKFYPQIELYTNKAGKDLLIDKLKLPYSKVYLVFDEINIPESSWVYYKVFTYSLQNEPFIHVDGDVYISKEFPQNLLTGSLVAQNQELHFPFYSETIDLINNQNIPLPDILKTNFPEITFNAGIIGGNNIDFFKEYSKVVLDYISEHFEQLKSLPNSACSMLLEQGIFSVLVEKYQEKVCCAFEDTIDDITYQGVSNLYEIESKRWYVHFMNETKRNRFYLKQLVSKIRQENPDAYYEILRMCQQEGIVLDFKVYSLDVLSPQKNSNEYFKELINNFQLKKVVFPTNDWKYYYAKDAFIYNQIEYFQTFSESNIDALQLLKCEDFQLLDTSSDLETSQSVVLMDTFSTEEAVIVLEDLEIILLSTISISELKTFQEIIHEISKYFDETDFKENQTILTKLLLEKISTFIFRGLIRIF